MDDTSPEPFLDVEDGYDHFKNSMKPEFLEGNIYDSQGESGSDSQMDFCG